MLNDSKDDKVDVPAERSKGHQADVDTITSDVDRSLPLRAGSKPG